MQVAVRKPKKGTLVLTLWLHEYFAVNGRKAKGATKRDVDIYQAVEFSTGGELPLAVRQGLSEKEGSQIWVKGVYLAPAARIRRANPDLPLHIKHHLTT